MAYFYHSLNAAKMQSDLKKNKDLWHSDRTSDIYDRFMKVDGLLSAIENRNQDEIMKLYYWAQHQHTLSSDPPFEVPIYIEQENINPNWIQHVQNAMQCINEAAPGLYLFESEDRSKSKIVINHCGDPLEAWTITDLQSTIHLGNEWPTDNMKGTAIHELLHALGFEHEMQRLDAELYLDISIPAEDECRSKQYHADNYLALTRFDPFSVLMYPEDEYMKRKDEDPIWKMKPCKNRLQELSELNKVALNLLYKPCVSPLYSPKLSKVTGMLYCNREVMATHNQNCPGTTDGFCGPNNWANCPACRVIVEYTDDEDGTIKSISKIKSCINRGMWQGLSGLFYCGRRYCEGFYTVREGVTVHSDGVCGFDNGLPCNQCGKELDPNYEWESWFFNGILQLNNDT